VIVKSELKLQGNLPEKISQRIGGFTLQVAGIDIYHLVEPARYMQPHGIGMFEGSLLFGLMVQQPAVV